MLMIVNMIAFVLSFTSLLLDFEHHFISARFLPINIFAFIAFAKVSAVNALLETLAIFLLAIGLLTVAPSEVPFLFISYGQDT